MKLLNFWLSGRPRTWDDLQALQNQIALVEAQFGGNGAFIFNGCEVTPNGGNYDIAAGLVFIDGKLLEFQTVVNVALPVKLIAGAPVNSDSRNDAAANTHFAFTEIKAVVGVPAGAAEFIDITSAGGRNFFDVVAEGMDLAGLLSVLANATQPAWQNLVLNAAAIGNGFASDYQPAFHKDTLGFVRLRGFVTPVSTGVPSQTIIGQLPVGYRPLKVYTWQPSPDYWFWIDDDGVIYLNRINTDINWYPLEMIGGFFAGL